MWLNLKNKIMIKYLNQSINFKKWSNKKSTFIFNYLISLKEYKIKN